MKSENSGKRRIRQTLSPPQRPLCVVGRLGRKKRERAGHDGKGEERREPFPPSHRPPRAFYFFDN